MNNKVLFYIKRFQEASEREIPELLDEAITALPSCTVRYNLKDKRAYITKDVRNTLAHRIKESGIMQKDIATLLGMHRTALTDYLNGKRNIPYANLCQLLALFDIDL